MPNFLEQKNVLIVPLSLFIKFNKKIAAEKFANLFGKFFDDLFSCDEEIEEHEKFCEALLQKILASQIVADFNLGKKTKHEFTLELLNFLDLPSEKSTAIEDAWNSVIDLDRKSSEMLHTLIQLTHQGKSIYFIGDTNELHAQKILGLLADFSYNKLSFLENLPERLPTLPVAISRVSDSELTSNGLAPQIGTIYFCLSYAYKTLIEQPQNFFTKFFSSKPTPGLLTNLKISLNKIGKTQDDILFVNPYTKERSIIKKLGLETIGIEELKNLPAMSAEYLSPSCVVFHGNNTTIQPTTFNSR